ncbi:hypothetical protein PVIIG_03650 [Plasmodium vivax India VII]|uniref:VIR protein n=2 Tax=Plasmodium vivax TaxID=5855 RepID=A0A0J9SIK0_PLAVI|nr:hypothetical protein PVIIG_03650 [Plasmodium vivax India VII]
MEFKNGKRSRAKSKCIPEDTIPALKDIARNKSIREYCLNRDIIISNALQAGECEKYSLYIKDNFSVYEEFGRLFPDHKAHYEAYYDKCENYNPSNISPTSKCSQITLGDTSTEKDPSQGEGSILGGEKQGTSGPEGEGHLSFEQKRIDSHAQEEQTDFVEKGQGASLHVQGKQQVLVTELTVEPEPGLVEESAQSRINPSREPDDNPSIVTPISLSFLGIISLTTILYKFTPLGTFFNKSIHTNKSPINNLNEIREEYIEYMIKSGNKNKHNGSNYIAYNPT